MVLLRLLMINMGYRQSLRLSVAILYGALTLSASAQFMRLGPFDLDLNTSLQGIYTTNVDGARKSESELEREDYYIVWSVGSQLAGPTTPTSELNFSTALSIEKHFVRDDLDTVSDPFGDATLTHDMELGRFDFPTAISFRRENTQEQDATTRVFIPGQRRQRVVQDTRSFNQGVLYTFDPIRLNAQYSYVETRYPDEEFQIGDENSTTMGFGGAWDVFQIGGERRVTASYAYSREKTELVNRPEGAGSGEWQEQQSIGLTLQILTRPNLTYTLAYVKDDDDDWRVTHNVAISDQWELSPTVILDASASYTRDEQPRDDDISFVYNVGLSHEIDDTLRHNFRMSREPRDTFGSTTDTDSTTYNYNITKTGLFFANLSWVFNWSHEINRPQGPEAGPTERITRYATGLNHSRAMSRRLTRSFGYLYSYETSNLEDEPIEEHRVTVGLSFSF